VSSEYDVFLSFKNLGPDEDEELLAAARSHLQELSERHVRGAEPGEPVDSRARELQS
jgi:hypothetical protein